MGSDDRSPSAGNFTRWAIFLLVPVVLSAAAMPWILQNLRKGHAALPGGAGLEEGSPAPPRHPEAPTGAEIEAATESAIGAARLQQRNLEKSTIFAPREARTTPEGDRLAPFEGFGLSIGTTPAGARVRVNGDDVGETPIVTTVDCEAEQDVEVVVQKPGYQSSSRHVRCRSNALLEISVALSRPKRAR